MRPSKPVNRCKAVSSYLLSGVNIKKMVAQELSRHEEVGNIAQGNFTKIGRRPIFKFCTKDKEQNSQQNSLPSKSFKIRSFTKKARDNIQSLKGDENSQIFEKVGYIRNLKAINNRIQLFNHTRLSTAEKNRSEKDSIGVTANIYSKVKEIFKRDSSMKCTVGSQILVHEMSPGPSQIIEKIDLNFTHIDTESYRQIANKIHVNFNPSFKEKGQQTLIVVSIQTLMVHKKRLGKSQHGNYQEGKGHQKYHAFWSEETVELIKMIIGINKDSKNPRVKLAFKVSSSASMIDLRSILQASKMNYYCIFYPIMKFVECWKLYLLDPLLKDIKEVILMESKHSLHIQFPILNKSLKTMFITFAYDNMQTNMKAVEAIKRFLSNDGELNEDTFLQEEIQSSSAKCQQEVLTIQRNSLEAYKTFCLENKVYKAQKRQKCSQKTRQGSNEIKRRVLCQRQTNVPEFSFTNNGGLQQLQKQLKTERKGGCQQLCENLVQAFKKSGYPAGRGLNSGRRPTSSLDRVEDLDDIMTYIKCSSLRSKPLTQYISELVKRNSRILSQIENHLTTNNHLLFEKDRLSSRNSIQEADSVKENSIQQLHFQKRNDDKLQFKLYRIY